MPAVSIQFYQLGGLLADAPGWRSCHGSQLNAPPVQQILSERTAISEYAAVMVPYQGPTSPVQAVRLIAAEDGVLAVEVSLADRTDYILSAPDATERTCGSITLAGRFGCLSVAADGRPLRAYLLDGTRLACGDLECALPCGHTHLPVASVADRTLRLARPVPDDLRSFTECVLVGGTGYDVEEISGDVIRVRDYPVVEGEAVTLLHGRAWTR